MRGEPRRSLSRAAKRSTQASSAASRQHLRPTRVSVMGIAEAACFLVRHYTVIALLARLTFHVQ